MMYNYCVARSTSTRWIVKCRLVLLCTWFCRSPLEGASQRSMKLASLKTVQLVLVRFISDNIGKSRKLLALHNTGSVTFLHTLLYVKYLCTLLAANIIDDLSMLIESECKSVAKICNHTRLSLLTNNSYWSIWTGIVVQILHGPQFRLFSSKLWSLFLKLYYDKDWFIS